MATRTEPGGNKGRRYREQVLDEAFFKKPLSWAPTAQFFELSLHNGEPDAPEVAGGGLQNEISYPKYERPRLPRDMLTWQRAGNTVTNRIEARFALYQDGPTLRAPQGARAAAGHGAEGGIRRFDGQRSGGARDSARCGRARCRRGAIGGGTRAGARCCHGGGGVGAIRFAPGAGARLCRG